MSYPRLIQALVIEDDPGAHSLYDAAFDPLIASGVAAPLCYADCFQVANQHLTSNTIFHLVILDLRLPETPGLPPPDSIELGLGILDLCIKRDNYPIPSLLVISGYIGKARQGELEERVRAGFAYGRIFVKGPETVNEVNSAIEKVHLYGNLGIHIRDGGERQFPTLSPREMDLLRRCALAQTGCTGLDLTWWSAEYQRPTGQFADAMGWKKILMGRFLLDGGDKMSRPQFFKLIPASGADVILGNAKRLEHMLSHIKVRSTLETETRALLVTEKVGSSQADPISLADYLDRPQDEVQVELPKIGRDISSQVFSLGAPTPRILVKNAFLWKFHDPEVMERQWQYCGGQTILEELGLKVSPVELYLELRTNEQLIRFERQSHLHGDLNPTNVALDLLEDGAHAYIFDAEGCIPGSRVRDLAMLEVTSQLHQPANYAGSLVRNCKHLYSSEEVQPRTVSNSAQSDLVNNTESLILEIRRQAETVAPSSIYSLLVFDNALIQLGGLEITISRNKITNPADAGVLAALACHWLLQFDFSESVVGNEASSGPATSDILR